MVLKPEVNGAKTGEPQANAAVWMGDLWERTGSLAGGGEGWLNPVFYQDKMDKDTHFLSLATRCSAIGALSPEATPVGLAHSWTVYLPNEEAVFFVKLNCL